MRIFTGLLWFFYKIIVFYTLVVYALSYWTPTAHWVAGFMMMSLPLMVVVHLVFLLIWLVTAPRKALVTLGVLLVGLLFLDRTFQMNTPSEPTPTDLPRLTVLNYNVLNFNMSNYVTGKDKITTEQTGQWLKQQDADVLCFQEFYSRPDLPALNIVSLLKEAGYPYHAVIDSEKGKSKFHQYGLAVFSRYPIISHRDTMFQNQNGLLQTDILWQQDTIRVVSVHLFSMTLKLHKLVKQDELRGVKKETRGTLRQLRRGFQERSQEVAALEQWTAHSPHPVIICGDFNETPYSYVYGRMKKHFANAFERKGQGFGFSYNSLPYFIRIDHQFYSADQLTLQSFETLNGIPYSDHYPLRGSYSIKESSSL
jgi:endonuclease/exonuclease/phosphatase (EEP) superfamily protein YafD